MIQRLRSLLGFSAPVKTQGQGLIAENTQFRQLLELVDRRPGDDYEKTLLLTDRHPMTHSQHPIQDDLKFEFAGFTHPGRVRKHNEDTIGYNQELGVAVVADGMGGHSAGEIASQICVDYILNRLQKLSRHKSASSITGSQLLQVLSNTICRSNTVIRQASSQGEGSKRMGTTVVSTVTRGNSVYVGHAGDSRLYLLRNEGLKRLTKDHSLIEELIDKGFYTEKEARTAHVRHIVTKALGTEESIEISTACHQVEPGDLLMLCSDGLTDMVGDEEILYTLLTYPSGLKHRARRLIEMAIHRGGKDNVSVILIQVSKKN